MATEQQMARLPTQGLPFATVYYISVDNYTPWGASGTFDICINNATSVEYYSIGSGDWSNTANWSTTGFSGTTCGTIPTTGNVVNIQDHTINVSTAQSCAQINMTVSSSSTGLIVNNAQLTVHGTYNQTNTGTNADMIATIQITAYSRSWTMPISPEAVAPIIFN